VNFYSVTIISSSSKWMGNYSIEKTSYNMNEVLVHKFDRKYERPTWSIALIILGAGIGILSATVVFKKGFPSFWFFALSVIGAFFGLGASDSLVCDQAQRKQASVERQREGYAGRFAIVDGEKWEKFEKSLKMRSPD
jgi:hypothetical protein